MFRCRCRPTITSSCCRRAGDASIPTAFGSTTAPTTPRHSAPTAASIRGGIQEGPVGSASRPLRRVADLGAQPSRRGLAGRDLDVFTHPPGAVRRIDVAACAYRAGPARAGSSDRGRDRPRGRRTARPSRTRPRTLPTGIEGSPGGGPNAGDHGAGVATAGRRSTSVEADAPSDDEDDGEDAETAQVIPLPVFDARKEAESWRL